MPRKEEYYNYFNEGVAFDEISKKFNVKRQTVYNHFFKYMFKSDISKYNNFIKKELPSINDINKIIKMTKNNNKINFIKKRINKNISYEQIRLVQNLDRTDQLREFRLSLSKSKDNAKNKMNEKDEWKKRKSLFGFLEYKYQNRIKIAIGEYLSHELVEWSNNGKIIAKYKLNQMDRKSLAEEYLENDGYKRIKKDDYKFRFEPKPEKIIEDVAKQIDFKIPKNYYLKKKDLNLGYEDHSTSINDYKGIHSLSGLKFKYVENYIRDEYFINKKSLGFIDFQKDIIPYVESELNDYGFTFEIPKHKLDEKTCLLILHYLWYEDNSEEVFNYIDYEL